jgi:dephospho-CoA kinase
MVKSDHSTILKGKTATEMGRSFPIIVGLTGSLASGKSTTLKVFKKRGWVTGSADEMVADIYRSRGLTKESIVKKYGRSRSGLKRLEQWVHPLVKQKIFRLFKLGLKTSRPVCVEVPLLFEAHFDEFFQATIFVFAPKADRIRRVRSRGMDLKLFRFLDAQQWPAKTKMRMADFTLRNDTKKNLKASAKQIAKKLEALC